MDTYDKIIAELKDEFPKFKIIKKSDSTLMKALDIGLKIITFGKMKTFMKNFTTTFLYTIYTPEVWDEIDKVGVLSHERVHMRQLQRYGILWFWFSYMFLWTPCVFAYFRKKYEQEAYEESIRYKAKTRGIKYVESDEYREYIIGNFTSASYFWTWPFRKSIEEWFNTTIDKVRLEMGLSPHTRTT